MASSRYAWPFFSVSVATVSNRRAEPGRPLVVRRVERDGVDDVLDDAHVGSWRERLHVASEVVADRRDEVRVAEGEPCGEPVIAGDQSPLKARVVLADHAPARRLWRPMTSAGRPAEYTCAWTMSGRQPSRRSPRSAESIPVSCAAIAAGRNAGRL